jgi:hypothetical protein
VYPVKPVGIHVIGEPGRTAYAGNKNILFPWHAQLDEGFPDCIQDGMVTASRAPSDFLGTFQILRCILI